MDQANITALIAGGTAVAGSSITGLFLCFNGWRERIAQTRRNQAELALKTALDHWKAHADIGIQLKKGGFLMPYYTFAIPLLAVLNEFGARRLDAEAVERMLGTYDVITKACEQHARDEMAKQQTAHATST